MKKPRLNKILREILSTKRPTKDVVQNVKFATELLRKHGIKYHYDKHGNLSVKIGTAATCFTAHTDTVDNKTGFNELEITPEGFVQVKDGGVLGADDGSGMYILIRMIRAKKPGLYVFFSSEEQGRIGSDAYEMPDYIKRCVSFDRKGTDNLITHQMSERGCSEAFADAFIAAFGLPYVKDPTGSFTDSYSFFDTVPECINLSVGYYNQHSKNESQDIGFLEQLVDACIAMDWEALPIERDPTKKVYDAYGDDDWWYGGRYGNYLQKHRQALTTTTPSKTAALTHSHQDDELPETLSFEELEREEMIEFCEENPEIVAEVLEEYGITVSDLLRYKNFGYLPGNGI